MKILISGAGIAGNALAFWLAKLGHDITVVERFPSLRTNGLQVDLRGHGVEVLKRMGLEEGFKSKMAPEQGMQMVDSSGRRRAYFPADKNSGKGATSTQSFTTDHEIMRGDLCELIYAPTKDQVNYVFGVLVESFELVDRGVNIRFSDHTSARFDLWVGADGSASRTRKMMLGPDVKDAFTPLPNLCVAYFTIPRPMQPGEEYIATMYQTTNHRGVMTRRSNPKELQVYLGGKIKSERMNRVRAGDTEEEKSILKEVFAGAGWQTKEILGDLDSTDNFYCERMGLVKLDTWYKGPIVLLGDAAYCPSAMTGMGTTSAIVGAYVLAGEIGRHCCLYDTSFGARGIPEALEAYQTKFQPFMEIVQDGVDKADNPIWEAFSSSAFGVGAMNIMMGIASILRINIYRFFLKESAVGQWRLPHYEELGANMKRTLSREPGNQGPPEVG